MLYKYNAHQKNNEEFVDQCPYTVAYNSQSLPYPYRNNTQHRLITNPNNNLPQFRIFYFWVLRLQFLFVLLGCVCLFTASET